MPPPYILAELEYVSEARRPHLGRDLARRHPDALRPRGQEAVDQYRCCIGRGEWHVDPKLEAPPDRPIQQLSMVGGGHHHDVAGQLIELHQQKRDDAFDLACLVDVAAFLPHRVELVEEQHAGRRPYVFEQASEPGVRLPEVGADQGVVTHGQQRNGDRFGDRLRERGLAVARWTGEEDAVPRLHALRSQEVGTVVFLDELPG